MAAQCPNRPEASGVFPRDHLALNRRGGSNGGAYTSHVYRWADLSSGGKSLRGRHLTVDGRGAEVNR